MIIHNNNNNDISNMIISNTYIDNNNAGELISKTICSYHYVTTAIRLLV